MGRETISEDELSLLLTPGHNRAYEGWSYWDPMHGHHLGAVASEGLPT